MFLLCPLCHNLGFNDTLNIFINYVARGQHPAQTWIGGRTVSYQIIVFKFSCAIKTLSIVIKEEESFEYFILDLFCQLSILCCSLSRSQCRQLAVCRCRCRILTHLDVALFSQRTQQLHLCLVLINRFKDFPQLNTSFKTR